MLKALIICLSLLSFVAGADVMQFEDYKQYKSLENEYHTNDSLITVLNENITDLKEFNQSDIMIDIINDIGLKIISLESRNNYLNIKMIDLYESSKINSVIVNEYKTDSIRNN